MAKSMVDVATTLNNLARLYEAEGRYADGVPLSLRAIEILENLEMARHPYMAATLNNLGALYTGLGRYEDAEAALS